MLVLPLPIGNLPGWHTKLPEMDNQKIEKQIAVSSCEQQSTMRSIVHSPIKSQLSCGLKEFTVWTSNTLRRLDRQSFV